MSFDVIVIKLYEWLVGVFVIEMDVVNMMICDWMVFENVLCIFEVIVYLIEVGGKCIWFMLMLVVVKMCGYDGLFYIYLVVMVEFIYIVMLLYDDVVDESE